MNDEKIDRMLDYLYGTFSGMGVYKDVINQTTKLDKIQKILDEVVEKLNSKFIMKFEWKFDFKYEYCFCIIGEKPDWNIRYNFSEDEIKYMIEKLCNIDSFYNNIVNFIMYSYINDKLLR